MTDWTLLSGSNVNTVSRRGEVVRRELSAASPAVHELLGHLERRMVPFVPRLLDHDQTHEYLTFLPGKACYRPWPEGVREEGTSWLTDLGRWLRTYHKAVQGFRVQNSGFLWGPKDPAPEMLVCHGDIGPWNLLETSGAAHRRH